MLLAWQYRVSRDFFQKTRTPVLAVQLRYSRFELSRNASGIRNGLSLRRFSPTQQYSRVYLPARGARGGSKDDFGVGGHVSICEISSRSPRRSVAMPPEAFRRATDHS